MILDIHTHNTEATNAIINLPMMALEGQYPVLHPNKYYSAGIFPLYEGDWEVAFLNLKQLATHPQVLYIGECGLDNRKPQTMALQLEYYQRQLELAASVHKPVLIHCVHCWNEIIKCNTLFPAKEKRIIHGFRGKPQLARQLLDAGFDLSFGLHFHPESLKLCPEGRRYHETDDLRDVTIENIREIHEKWL